MRNLYTLTMLVFCSALATNVSAEDMPVSAIDAPVATVAPASTMDPTLTFFAALAACTPGTYSEKNILSAEVGQSSLTQQIVGLSDDKLACNAILMTPDNRMLTCAFPMNALVQVNDQHFLEGMLEASMDNPGQNSINADIVWSKLKAEYCGL